MQHHKAYKTKKLIKKLAVLLIWLGVWQCLFIIIGQDILFASPIAVFKRLTELIHTSDFWISLVYSFLRIISGYILGLVIGSILAFITWRFKFIDEILSPLLIIIKSTPVASFIILALVWIKKDFIPIFIVFLIVLPIIWSNVRQGIEQTDKQLLDMAAVFNLGRIKTLKMIYLHSVLPFFAAGATTALGLAWKSGVAAEVLAMPVRSLGYNLYRSKISIETIDLFAWTAVVVILSLIFEKIVSFLINKYSENK